MSRIKKLACGVVCSLAVVIAQAATLPSGYTEVACITVTNQEQYINTGFTPYWMTDIEAHFSVPDFSKDNVLYWTRTGDNTSFAFITKANSADTSKTKSVRAYRSSNGNGDKLIELPDCLTENDIWYSTEKTDNTFTVNGQKVSFVQAAVIGRIPAIFLFRLNNNDSLYSGVKAVVGVKLYSFKVIENGTAVADLVPCLRESDSVAGLYDTVREAFYPNSGSGGSFGYETLATTLDVTGLPDAAGTPSPAYGRVFGLAAGQTKAVSCGETPATDSSGTRKYTCTGWKLYDADGTLLDSGSDTSFTYTHPTPAAHRRLVWQWEVDSVSGTVAAGDGGSVSPSGTAWYAVDTPLTVTATPDSGKEFVGWTGTLPSGISATSASVTFTPTAPFEMTANFCTCFCVATTGDDDNPGTEAEPLATISNAIEKADAAIAGGAQIVKINVADGSYPENGLVVTNAIVISGNAADRTAVKIGKTGARVFRIANAGAALRNLTVQDGTLTAADMAYAGGNVRLEAGTVTNCVLTGGGKSSLSGGRGGNIYVSGGSVVDCLMTSPLAGPGIYGGSAYIAGGVVSRCIIENTPQTSRETARGGGACLIGGVIDNCLLRGNHAGSGTIALYNAAKAVNCTIVDNVPETYGGGGVAGVMITGSSASAINCVIYGNGGTATAEWANQSGACFFSCAFAADAAFTGANTTVTNLTDAAFKSVAAGDYRPRCRGALFNAGDNERYASSATSALDLDGNPRIQGKIIDIGCWEVQSGLGLQIIVR